MSMRIGKLQALTLAAAGCAVLLCSPVTAQGPVDSAKFAQPRRIKAGDAFLGEGRLYPSPVLHDVDGDGLPDIVIGDLFGRVTCAPRTPGQTIVTFGAEMKLKDRDGEQLKFHNW